MYNINETNPLQDPSAYHQSRQDVQLYLSWNDPDLAQVTRLRLISDRGFPFWDVSFCHGITKDGEMCDVQLPFHQIPKGQVSRFIVQQARRDGVFAKGLGILDNISTLM